MPLYTINLKICHPERSSILSEAIDRAQSKDPYPRRTLVECIEEFSHESDLPEVGENSLKQQSRMKRKGILRLRERLRARSPQDDNNTGH